MARKWYGEITIKEEDIKLKDILSDDNATPEMLIAASVILEDQIESLKACANIVDEKIKSNKFDDVIADAASRGLIQSWEEPKITIETKYGGKIIATIAKGEDDGFKIDKALSEKSTLNSVVPAAYKKTSVVLDRKKIEDDFNAGVLPTILKSYCSKSPTEYLRVRKTVEKAGS